MSTSVCLSVREHISGVTRAIFTKVFVHVAYGRDTVLLQQGDEISKKWAILRVFPPLTMHCNAFAANNVMQQKGSFRRYRVRWKWNRSGRGDGSAQCGRSLICDCLIMVALCNRADHYTFAL